MGSMRTGIEWTEAHLEPRHRVRPGIRGVRQLLRSRDGRPAGAMGNPRYQRDGDPRTSGPGFGLTVHPDKLDEPFTRPRPRIVFVNSMSDLFHKEVPIDFIADVFAVMDATPQHTYQVLT